MKRKESGRRRRRFSASTRSLARRRLASRDFPLPVSGFGDSPSHRGRFRHSPSIRGCFRRSTASVDVVFVDAALLSCFLSFLHSFLEPPFGALKASSLHASFGGKIIFFHVYIFTLVLTLILSPVA